MLTKEQKEKLIQKLEALEAENLFLKETNQQMQKSIDELLIEIDEYTSCIYNLQ